MRQTQHNKAFTIVELLTVMAVIALLIGLLVPALALVKDRAKDIQQRAQFHAITAGLEMFKADFGDYPDSKDNSVAAPALHPDDPNPYTGANKLAEAMVGMDYLGFHPNSDFRADGRNLVTPKVQPPLSLDVYVYDTSGVPNWQTQQENVQSRKGPYVELENANAFYMDEVYATGVNLTPFVDNIQTDRYPMVLCDVYSRKRSGFGGKKTGTPILYFRAKTFNTIQDSDLAIDISIYDWRNNMRMLALGMPDDSGPHAIFTGDPLINFDEMIRNKNVTTIQRPYRAGSFILWSAGKDGMFGTADDVFNFTREAE